MQNRSKTGGILSIISGALGVLGGIFIAVLVPLIVSMTSSSSFSRADRAAVEAVAAVYIVLGVIAILISALAIIGGIYAIKKRLWGLALTGAIAGTLAFLPTGIPAIIFTALGKPEFDARQATPPPPVAPSSPEKQNY